MHLTFNQKHSERESEKKHEASNLKSKEDGDGDTNQMGKFEILKQRIAVLLQNLSGARAIMIPKNQLYYCIHEYITTITFS
jgi:hypothetical protein